MSHAPEIAAPTTTSEHVDDIPLLLAHLQRVGIQRLIDTHFPAQQPAGGLSMGWLATAWLAHILSQSSNQPKHMRAWVVAHQETLRWCTGQHLRPPDVSDQRLREVLHAFNDDTHWTPFETALNQHILRMYRILPERVQLRSSTDYWHITSEGLLQLDRGKRWWPGALPVQVTMTILEPFGIPATVHVAAHTDALQEASLNTIAQTRATLQARRVVFIGNGELSSPEARAAIHAGNNAYLCLFSDQELFERESSGIETILPIFRTNADNQQEHIADGYEQNETVYTTLMDQPVEWSERRLFVRSMQHAAQQEIDLHTRLAQAQSALAALNERKRGKRRPRTFAALRETAEAILVDYRVQGLLRIRFDETVDERVVRRYRGRPTVKRVERMVEVITEPDQAAIAAQLERFGWEVYATTLPSDALSISQAIQACVRPEHLFERLRGRPLSLAPTVMHRPEQIRGLIRLLALGLRSIILLDLVGRFRAGDTTETAFQRAQGTQLDHSPMGERLLEAFRDLSLTIISDSQQPRYHLTALSALQRRILDFLALPYDTYQLHR